MGNAALPFALSVSLSEETFCFSPSAAPPSSETLDSSVQREKGNMNYMELNYRESPHPLFLFISLISFVFLCLPVSLSLC